MKKVDDTILRVELLVLSKYLLVEKTMESVRGCEQLIEYKICRFKEFGHPVKRWRQSWTVPFLSTHNIVMGLYFWIHFRIRHNLTCLIKRILSTAAQTAWDYWNQTILHFWKHFFMSFLFLRNFQNENKDSIFFLSK